MQHQRLEELFPAEKGIAELPEPLQALWYDAQGDWEQAHELVQDGDGEDAAWVHAYLHRKEGDNSNARYWYAQANKDFSPDTLETEWEKIVVQLLEKK